MVKITKASQTWLFKTDTLSGTLNGKAATITAPFKVASNKVYVPTSFLNKFFAAKVEWDMSNNIKITK